jgi:Phage integrase family
MPLLFQRRYGSEDRPITRSYIRECMVMTSRAAQITAAGQPLEWRPHDFRRIFVTDAIRSGLPPHIAAKICGHALLDTTMGYAAIYPEDVISHHRALHRPPQSRAAQRRIPRPHRRRMGRLPRPFRSLRKVALGVCGRDYGTSCAHEEKLASDAPCSGLTQLRCRGWRRSTPASPAGSPRPGNKAGSARSPRSRPPWPLPPRNSRPCATSLLATAPSTSACPTSAARPDDPPRRALTVPVLEHPLRDNVLTPAADKGNFPRERPAGAHPAR